VVLATSSGLITGGAGGQDAIAIEDPSNLGNLAVILPGSTGNGTLAANAVVDSSVKLSQIPIEH
jgi:hypothetical protein